MAITKEQFKKYERVRASGVTNMFAVNVVSQISGLKREQILEIMEHYSELYSKYMEKKKLKEVI